MLISRRAVAVGRAFAIGVVTMLLVPAVAGADWVEPVVGPLNQTNAFATAIRGNGSEPLVAMAQYGPNSLNVASLGFGGAWRLSPPLDRNPGQPLGTGASITPSGPVYASWIERRTAPTANFEVYVARYLGGGNWSPVAASLNHNETNDAAMISQPAIANIGNGPWVAWQEAPDDAIWVARLDGNNLSYVGGPLPVGHVAASPALTSVNGVPYLAYAAADRLHVVTLKNGSWVDVPGLVAPSGSFSPAIAAVAGRVFLAWTQSDANGHALLHTARYVGNGHWIADPSLNIDQNESSYGPHIAAVGDVPWIVWTESSHPFSDNRVLNHVYVKQFNGATWNQVGGVLNVDVNQSAYGAGIADVAGNAWVAMTQAQTNGGTAVRVKESQQFVPHVSSLSTTTARGGSASGKIRFRIVLSGPATVHLSFTQPVKGRRDRGVCVPRTSRNAHLPGCTIDAVRGGLSFKGHTGANTLLFDGTLSSRRHLPPGTYRVVITATGATGLRSVSGSVRVTI